MSTTGRARQRDVVVAPSIQSALRTVATERAGLFALERALAGPLGKAFAESVARIAQAKEAKGRVVITGMGKSGHVGKKVAATFASTGTPAFFVHPGEASHGDLGMITADDVVIALSWSGETRELGDIISFASRFGVTLIAFTAAADSTLGRAADIALVLPRTEEACPHGLAPTTSSLMQLALGDALAVALLESRGFTPSDFSVFHPGGKLGAALRFVREVMRNGEAMPLVAAGTLMSQAVLVMSNKGVGCVGVVDGQGRLLGIATDGDLRRHMAPDLMTRSVDDIMTRSPKTVRPDVLVGEALELMEKHRISALFAMDGPKPVGVLHMHDLLRIGLV